MNKAKKLYCRTFQTGLKIALPFLPYRKPEVIGSVKTIPDILKKRKCSHALIITDTGIRNLGLTKRLENVLTKDGIPFCIYDKTVANPTTANVAEALEMYLSNGCDAITKLKKLELMGEAAPVWTVPRQSEPASRSRSNPWPR